MKTKKVVSAVLTVALLIFALLVSSCMDLTEEVTKNDTEDNQVTPGRGLVRFNFSNSAARTIFPDTDISKMYFRFTFTPHGGGTAITVPKTANTTLQVTHNAGGGPVLPSDTISFAIDDGTYDVSVNAYNESTGATANLISGADGAKNLTTGYEVDSAGSTCEISLTLGGRISKANWDGAGGAAKQGTFAYAITLPTIPSDRDNTAAGKFINVSHKLSVYPYDGGVKGTVLDDFDEKNISGASSGSAKIDSGVYLIEVVSKMAYCQDRVLTEVMHVYDNLTTTYSKAAPAFNQNLFTVNLELGTDIKNTTYARTKEVGNAELVDSLSTPLDENDDYSFDDWYANSGLTTKFNFGTTKIYSDDVTIYAKWNQVVTSGGDVVVTLAFTPISTTANILATYYTNKPTTGIVTFDGLDGTHSIEIELTDVKSVKSCKFSDGTTDLISLLDGDGTIGDPFVITIDSTAMAGVLNKKLVFGNNKNIITVTGIDSGDKEISLEIAVNVSK